MWVLKSPRNGRRMISDKMVYKVYRQWTETGMKIQL